jgi:DNA-binding XRE family transcriptional regulator
VIRLDQPSDFTPALRRMRQDAALTQRDLGHNAGITHTTISLIERGSYGTTLHTLLRLAHALGYDLALIPREDAAQREPHCEDCGGPCRDETDLGDA